MGKKRKGNKYAVPAIPEERLAQLVEALDTDNLASLTDAELLGLVGELVETEAVEKLAALAGRVTSKPQRKAVNQALFKLKQRGLEVPDIRNRPVPVVVAAPAPSVDDLQAMMSAPHGNATRIFFFPYASGRSLLFVRVELKEPAGLFELRSTTTSRSAYRLMLQQVTEMEVRPGEPPPFLPVTRAMVDRKLWEIGRLVRAGRTGGAVDHETSGLLNYPTETPPHPALSFDLDAIEPLSIAELDQNKYALAPVMHEAVFTKLEAKLAELEGGVLVLTDAQKEDQAADVEAKLVDEWVEDWGFDNVAEVLLDTAYFHHSAGDVRAARTFIDVVAAPDETARNARIVSFLVDVVRQLRLGVVETEPADEEISSGGIIIP